MDFSERRNRARWFIIITSLLVVSLILWNTYTFFQIFKGEERQKMQLWAAAMKEVNLADVNDDLELATDIFTTNKTIPLILVHDGKIENHKNIDEDIVQNPQKLKAFLESIKKENEPIRIEIAKGKYQYLYYGNSSLLNKLKYYPVALVLIIVLFMALVYNFYQSNKMAIQNKLWAGMAKETAHQIGTPLSSLMGWLEIMKVDNMDQTMIEEIEKDISRLQTITDRFSKIGSEPVLAESDIVAETEHAYDYLRTRFTGQVAFSFAGPSYPINIRVNSALHGWTIENLVKNAIDAMKGRGTLDVTIIDEDPFVRIYVSDSGKGIPKKEFSKVFEPGFTTKKRGWGLGLSLTRRIVEEYHKGRIKVLRSEIGKGTTMQVSFKKMGS